MENNSQLQIYKGMIGYLLESTHYTLKHIAELSSSSINNIRSIYLDGQLPVDFSSGLALTNVYLIVLGTNLSKHIAYQSKKTS